MNHNCYIQFTFLQPSKSGRTKEFSVERCDGEPIGEVKWDAKWRQYVFLPEAETKWSSGCLNVIQAFMEKINKEHKEKLR